VQESINLLSLSDQGLGISYLNACPPELFILGDEQRLVQVFVNLLTNARDASPDGGEVQVIGEADGYSAIIEVIDQGSGIAADKLDHIFEPFYTTKPTNKGTGLGLALVYSIVEEHYGNIQAQSPAYSPAQLNAADSRNPCTCIRLKLPAYEPEDTPAACSQNQRS
jgi:signal transduction histidine kinase